MKFIDDIKSLTLKEGLGQLYRVSLYRNAVYLILSSGATGIFAFVFWILVARFSPADEVGLASAAIAVAAFLVTLSNLGLDYGLVRYIPDSGKRYNTLVNSCLTISLVATIIVSAVFLLGAGVWSPDLVFLRESPLNIVAFSLLNIALALYVIINSIIVSHKRTGFTLSQTIIQGVVKLALVVSLPGFLYSFGIFASWGIGFAVAVLAGLLFLLPRLKKDYRFTPAINKAAIGELAHFSFTNYIAGLITKVPTFVLPLMVISALSAEQNAYFYMAYAVISNVLLLIPAGISLSLFAEGSHNEATLGTYVRKSLKFSLLILVPLIVIVFLVGGKILLLFGSDYSAEATRLLWVLAISSLPLSVNTIYFHKKRVEKKMNSVIILSALTVAITLGVSYYLLPIMGIMGAGIAWLAGNGVVTIAIMGSLLKRK